MNKAVKEFSDHYQLLDALIAEDAQPLAEGEFTVRMIAERAECGNQKAKRMILDWVKAGKAESVGKRKGNHGQMVEAWRLT